MGWLNFYSPKVPTLLHEVRGRTCTVTPGGGSVPDTLTQNPFTSFGHSGPVLSRLSGFSTRQQTDEVEALGSFGGRESVKRDDTLPYCDT